MSDVNTSVDNLVVKLGSLHEDVGEIKVALGKLSDAIVKLALVEERQSQTAIALERAFSSIERLDARVDAIEKHGSDNTRIRRLVDSFVVGSSILVFMYIAKITGIL